MNDGRVDKKRRRESLADSLRGDPKASRAYQNLIKAGANVQQLELLVGVVLSSYKIPRSFDPLGVPGMTKTEVSKFPNKLRSIARALDSLAEHPHFGDLDNADFRAKLLSTLLRGYADYLEGLIRSFRSWLEKHPRHFDLQSSLKLKLLRYVKSSTGRPRYQWVADLVNGALGVTYSHDRMPDVTPSALRQLETRGNAKKERQDRYRRMARAMG